MNEATGDHDNVRSQERSDLSSSPITSGASFPTPPLSQHHRPVYHRISSGAEADTAYRGAEPEPSSPLNATVKKNSGHRSQNRGLAIENVGSLRSLSGTPTPSGSNASPEIPGSVDPLLSPASTRVGKGFGGLSSHLREEEGQDGPGYSRNYTSLFLPYEASSDRERLHRTGSITSIEAQGGQLDFKCRTKRPIMQSRANCLSITILVLAVYSTVFSGIWLGLAIRKPRYGRWITSNSRFPPSTASLVSAAIAKSIELSFVTVFVALLGQILSRRAFAKRSKGISIADMTMRAWIMQPGTLITHWHTIRYAGPTILGVISLLAALIAMLYTTASDALVAPKLKFGNTENRILYGPVLTSFANPIHIKDQCQTPISMQTDPNYSASTCISLEHAGQSYHNYFQYLAEWTNKIDRGNTSDSLMTRPRPTATIYDNTTVEGSWIHLQDMAESPLEIGSRIINNVTMAMPHAGVFAAAREPLNNIVQPQELNGLGEYFIEASVPSPSVNVLCASMNDDDLAPMVYEKWPSAKPLNTTSWPSGYDIPPPPSWLNKTPVDDVFGFGENYGRRHPVFAKLPMPFNIILNYSIIGDGDSIYLLATSETKNYTLCSVRESLTPNCSTEYRASMSGGQLTTRCDDPKNELSYHRSDPTAPNGVLDKDWTNVAIDWATAINLNDGINDGQSSNARLLTQLILTTQKLNPSLPSIAEALAVLAGCTLLLSSLDSPFVHFWNYSTHTLKTPQYQPFNASLRTQDYSSGGTQHWQNIFYIVLILVFITNVFCLIWLIVRGGFITDFTEPENLFSISLNSPPSQSLDGSCGGGPEEEQLGTRWFINLDPNREHFYIQEGTHQPVRRKKKVKQGDYELVHSPITNMYLKLATKRRSIL